MGRYLVLAVGVTCVIALNAAPAAAQVDIGVWTPRGGGRVIVGSPRIYYPPPVYVYREPPIYAVRPYYPRYPRPRGRGWARGHARRYAAVGPVYYSGDRYGYGRPRYSDRVYRRGPDPYRRRR
jgi:hypothetical protein